TKGTRVGIVGLGGLGFNGAQIALALGATVYAVEPRTEVHGLAKDLGVTEVVTDATELEQFELDVIADFAGFGTTTAGAVLAVRPGGRVVLVGVGHDEMTINTPIFIQKQVQLIGSSGGTLEDLAGYYELVASGKVKPVISTITFDQIKDGLDDVAAGKVTGRLVAVLGE
ncbi:MAG: zinc-binding dehydrogenase, partial [Leucobacter sp.]